jgi:hypothetical protein
MTVQTLKIGKREFVVVAKRDFDKLAARAGRQEAEDAYWTQVALQAEAESRARNEKPIPLAEIEREIEARRRRRRQSHNSSPGKHAVRKRR